MTKTNLLWIVATLMIVAIFPLQSKGIFLFTGDCSIEGSAFFALCMIAFVVAWTMAASIANGLPLVCCSILASVAATYGLGGGIGWILWAILGNLIFALAVFSLDWEKIQREQEQAEQRRKGA